MTKNEFFFEEGTLVRHKSREYPENMVVLDYNSIDFLVTCRYYNLVTGYYVKETFKSCELVSL